MDDFLEKMKRALEQELKDVNYCIKRQEEELQELYERKKTLEKALEQIEAKIGGD